MRCMRVQQQTSLQLKQIYEELGKAFWGIFLFHMILEEHGRVYNTPHVKTGTTLVFGSALRFQETRSHWPPLL